MSSELIYGVFQRIQGGLHGAQRLLTARGWTARCGRNRCSGHSSRRRGRRSDSRPWRWRLRRGCPGKCRHRRRKRISLHVHVPDRGRDRLLQRRELLVEQGVGGVGGPASASPMIRGATARGDGCASIFSLSQCRMSEAAETEIGRFAALAQGLPFVTGFRPVRRPLPPILGAFGCPGESAVCEDRSERFTGVVAAVGGKSQLAAGCEHAPPVECRRLCEDEKGGTHRQLRSRRDHR